MFGVMDAIALGDSGDSEISESLDAFNWSDAELGSVVETSTGAIPVSTAVSAAKQAKFA